MRDFDIPVTGSGPGGRKAALAAAEPGRRAALVDRTGRLGGVSLHTGTIPSKTLREAALLVDAGFNHPTPAESCKVAAPDVTNRMRPIDRLGG